MTEALTPDSPEHRPDGPVDARGPHVLIIGGGLGGLCLAQGLAKSGISAAVYERDASAAIRGQGYRITLTKDGTAALRDCLPPRLFELCAATAIAMATTMAFFDHDLNPTFSKPIPARDQLSAFGVNRLTLREILLAGLESTVHFGKTFDRLEHLDTDQVRAHFTDGTTAAGDLLVGADGTHSVVRDIIVADAGLDDLGSAIYGKTPIHADTIRAVPACLVDSFNRVTAPDGTAVSVATCRKPRPYPDAIARYAPGVQLTDVPDYLAWTLSPPDHDFTTAAGACARPLGAASPDTLHQLAHAMLTGFHPAVRTIIDDADTAATFLVTISSARPVTPWQTISTTLLGDAIHTMSPGRGQGANTALRDAALLRRTLADAAAGTVPLTQAKRRYETEMLRYGFQAVHASRQRPFFPRAAAQWR